MSHKLKVLPEFYGALKDGSKLFELRKDDRDFQPGDWLTLREWEPASILEGRPARYTGRRVKRQVASVWAGDELGPVADYRWPEGYVLLSLMPPLRQLGCQLMGHNLYIESIDPHELASATSYMMNLHAMADALAEADAKREAERKTDPPA